MHPAGKELFRRYLQRIHHLYQFQQFLVLFDPEEITVFEPDEFFRLPVAADSLQDLIRTEFIRDQLHIEQAFRQRKPRVEGHAAPDPEPHEPLRRFYFAHGHQPGQPAVQESEQGLVAPGRQKDFLLLVLFCHDGREKIHEGVFRLGVPVMLRLGDMALPFLAVEGTMDIFPIINRRLAQHGILIDVQVADKLRLHRNIFLYQLRPDFCDLRHLSQLREGLSVKIGNRHPSYE